MRFLVLAGLVVAVIADPPHAAPYTQAIRRRPRRHLHQHPLPRLGRLSRLASGPHPRLCAQVLKGANAVSGGTGPSSSSSTTFTSSTSSDQNTSDVLGSLQVFKNVYSAHTMWMSPTYDEVCNMTLRLQVHRDSHVRTVIVHVLPTCARYDSPRLISRGQCGFIWIFGPRAPGTFLRVRLIILIVSPSRAQPWGVWPG